MAHEGYRGPNQDDMPRTELPKRSATYEDAGYLGTSENDDEEVADLGFIVEDHDDRRATLTGGWQRLDDLETDDPFGPHRKDPIPHEVALRERGAPEDWFATDYNIAHQRGERQEEEFVRTSMLPTDPDMNDGVDDFTDETLHDIHGRNLVTDLYGHVNGAAPGLGTSLPQDAGLDGFQIRDNPLMQPQGEPISHVDLSDPALGIRDVDEMGSEDELDSVADLAARDMEAADDR